MQYRKSGDSEPPLPTKLIRNNSLLQRISASFRIDYLRVYSGKREDLIRYRFSDAVNELRGVPGLQVHRSFWINTEAIDSIKRAGRSYEIVLKSGLEVSVSRSYRYAVKEAGLLTRFSSRTSPLFPKDPPSDPGANQISSI